jgi:hypothetical protein
MILIGVLRREIVVNYLDQALIIPSLKQGSSCFIVAIINY